MREIKFRAWCESELQMYPNVESGIYCDPDEIEGFDSILAFACYEVMQFTGLKDKNGVEIYEGDVVKCSYSPCYRFNAVVKFGTYTQDASGGEYTGSKCMGFYAEAINPKELDEFELEVVPEHSVTNSLLNFESIEIIGDIYRNPELLEVQE